MKISRCIQCDFFKKQILNYNTKVSIRVYIVRYAFVSSLKITKLSQRNLANVSNGVLHANDIPRRHGGEQFQR